MTLKKKISDSNILIFIVLHIALFIYSLGGICSKFASGKDFLSFDWIILYCGLLATMMIYALMWQQVLKRIPLTTAYLNSAVKVLWSMIWGLTMFGEKLTYTMLIGAIIVIIGVCFMVKNDE